MPVPQGYGNRGASCFDKMKIGFAMGFCVGMTTGVLFGGFGCIRYGLRGRELLSTVGKSMVSGGTTFGVFMAIGQGLRC